MDVSNLVKMANQIGQFFEIYPDRAEAQASVAEHLRRFWEPRMRQAIVTHLHASGAESGLTPLATAAIGLLDEAARSRR